VLSDCAKIRVEQLRALFEEFPQIHCLVHPFGDTMIRQTVSEKP
jgi:hypothetical protein